MKTFKLLVLAAVAAIGLTTSASALTFTDTVPDSSRKWLSATDSSTSNNSVTGWLDITTGNAPNYTPGMNFVLTGVTLSFAFADTYEPNVSGNWKDETDYNNSNTYKETVSIKLGNVDWMTNVEVDGKHPNYDWTSASGVLSKTFLDDLLVDGKLQYKVTIKSGDTWFKGANIVVSGYTSVPEASSTIALMGIGLLGLAILKRRK